MKSTNLTGRYQKTSPRVERNLVLLSVRIDKDTYRKIDDLAENADVPVITMLRNVISNNLVRIAK
jgi:predicted DNA-binding protein